MTYALKVIGTDKDKLKLAVLAQMAGDERTYGVPAHVVARVHDMIDAVVTMVGHAIEVDISGHQTQYGASETHRVGLVRLAE